MQTRIELGASDQYQRAVAQQIDHVGHDLLADERRAAGGLGRAQHTLLVVLAQTPGDQHAAVVGAGAVLGEFIVDLGLQAVVPAALAVHQLGLHADRAVD